MISILFHAVLFVSQIIGLNEGLRIEQNGRVIIARQHYVNTGATGDVPILADATACLDSNGNQLANSRIVVLSWVVDCASTETFRWEEEGDRVLTADFSLEAIAPPCSPAGCFWTQTPDDDLEFFKTGAVQCGISVVYTCIVD